MSHFKEINGVSLRVAYQRGGGVPIVLIHEMGGQLESWDFVVRALPERQILRYDQRGFGLSEKTATLRFDDHVADLCALIDTYFKGTKVMLAGVAVGGAIALATAAKIPDSVDRILAFGPSVGVPNPRKDGVLKLADKLEQNGLRDFFDADMVPNIWPEPRFAQRGEGFDTFRAIQLSAPPASLAAQYRILASLDIEDQLRSIRAPVLLTAGKHDIARPLNSIAPLADLMPHASIQEIDTGHFAHLQDPFLVAQLLSKFASAEGKEIHDVSP